MAKEKDVLKKLGKKLVEQIEKGQNPNLDVPIRSLSNVSFDSKSRMIRMGQNTSRRFFFNVGHVKKFLQTIEVASTAKELMEADKHISLRQTFYKMLCIIPDILLRVS